MWCLWCFKIPWVVGKLCMSFKRGGGVFKKLCLEQNGGSVENVFYRRGLVHLVLRRNEPPTDHQTNTPQGYNLAVLFNIMLSSHPLYQLYHMMLASSVCYPSSYNNAVHIQNARFGTEMGSNATCMFGMQKEVESPMTDVGNHPIPTNANLICAAISQHFAALNNNIKQPRLSLTPETF